MHTTLDMLLSVQALADEHIQDRIHLLRLPVAAKVCKTGCDCESCLGNKHVLGVVNRSGPSTEPSQIFLTPCPRSVPYYHLASATDSCYRSS